MKIMFETLTMRTVFETITRRTAFPRQFFIRKGRALFLTLLAILVVPNLCPANVHGQARVKAVHQQKSSTPEAMPNDRVEQAQADGLKIFALRLKPGQDLRTELEKFTKERNIKAGFMMTAVGSLKKALSKKKSAVLTPSTGILRFSIFLKKC